MQQKILKSKQCKQHQTPLVATLVRNATLNFNGTFYVFSRVQAGSVHQTLDDANYCDHLRETYTLLTTCQMWKLIVFDKDLLWKVWL